MAEWMKPGDIGGYEYPPEPKYPCDHECSLGTHAEDNDLRTLLVELFAIDGAWELGGAYYGDEWLAKYAALRAKVE
jgi:hypothetical protein